MNYEPDNENGDGEGYTTGRDWGGKEDKRGTNDEQYSLFVP